jgi:Ulp1 family protease
MYQLTFGLPQHLVHFPQIPVVYCNAPQQDNGTDCGLFTLLGMSTIINSFTEARTDLINQKG